MILDAQGIHVTEHAMGRYVTSFAMLDVNELTNSLHATGLPSSFPIPVSAARL
jgi:hypothetical protein